VNGGTESDTTITGSIPSMASEFIQLAKNYSTAFAQVDISEALFYNEVVASGNRTSIQNYLNTKYAAY